MDAPHCSSTNNLNETKENLKDASLRLKGVLANLSASLNSCKASRLSQTDMAEIMNEANVVQTALQENQRKYMMDMVSLDNSPNGAASSSPLPFEENCSVSRNKCTLNRCTSTEYSPNALDLLNCSLKQGIYPDEHRYDLLSCKIIQLTDQSDFHISIDSLSESITEDFELMGDIPSTPCVAFTPGTPVACTISDSVTPQRGVIVNCSNLQESITVYLVDKGVMNVLDVSQVYSLPSKFCEIPSLAIPCTLLGVENTKIDLFWREKFAVGFVPPCQVLCCYSGDCVRRGDGRTLYIIELYHPLTKKRITRPFVPK